LTVFTSQTTNPEVKKRTLRFIKEWTKEFGDDANLGMMGELFETLKARSETPGCCLMRELVAE
jgi:hypothetical protein